MENLIVVSARNRELLRAMMEDRVTFYPFKFPWFIFTDFSCSGRNNHLWLEIICDYYTYGWYYLPTYLPHHE